MLFPSCRYWPDNDGESGDGSQATQPAPALSLERLHQLARERAARRKSIKFKQIICVCGEFKQILLFSCLKDGPHLNSMTIMLIF